MLTALTLGGLAIGLFSVMFAYFPHLTVFILICAGVLFVGRRK